ncbi:MAG: hypothetical protein PUP93_07265 [Rhizonema sp. NSF051]|nr:hypothetical protein [Rhizonema sp. NSF051]
MENILKITSVILFLIGVHLAIPKIAEATKIVSNSTGKSDTEESKNLTGIKNNSQGLKHTRSNVELENDYEPRNYGGPDSFYGSGIR